MQRDDDPTYSSGYTGHPDASFHLVGSRRRAFDVASVGGVARQAGPDLDHGRAGCRQDRPGTAIRSGRSGAVVHGERRSGGGDECASSSCGWSDMRSGSRRRSRLGKARLRLEDALANEAAEGRRWLLVVDRAHRGRSGVWDEVQAIANQLGRSRGFAALFIVGETGLARWLASRRSSMGLVSQVRTHVHLKPLDLDEARDLLDSADVADVTDQEMLEELHRNSHGNTALLLRLAQSWSQRHRTLAGRAPIDPSERASAARIAALLAAPEEPSGLRGEAQPDLSGEVVKEQSGTTSRVGKGSARREVPALIPSKPPIRDEDGLVEVGWEGDLEDENPRPGRCDE